MKRIFAVILVLSLVFCLASCGKSKKEEPAADTEEETVEAQETAMPETTAEPVEDAAENGETTENLIEDEAWDTLESIGDVETENGILYVYITVPANLAGDDVTQENLDAQAGETYTSATLNEDGSITYKLTKSQHKAMLDDITAEIDSSLDGMTTSQDNAITGIEHNDDFSEFDVYLSTDDVGLAESFSVLTFYMCGGMYAVFEGQIANNIAVNFYNADGALISTANSSDMGE